MKVISVSQAGFEAHLVVDSEANGLAFGGTRVDEGVTRATVVELARCMTLKLAVHGSPVGGAKAGLRCRPDDPRLVTEWLPQFAERCRAELSTRTVLGKDMGATDAILDHLYDLLGFPQLHVVRRRTDSTRCPARIRELEGYVRHMTGRGVAIATQSAVRRDLRGVRVLIQGFGRVGAGTAYHLSRGGAAIVGVSDRLQCIARQRGLPYEALTAAVDGAGVLNPARLSCEHDLDDRQRLFELEADVLVLAASSHAVSGEVAKTIRCEMVVEGANQALTPDARRILHRRGVIVVPDIVANSSSAALVAHQLASANRAGEDEVWRRIEAAIARAVRETRAAARERDEEPRRAFESFLLAQGLLSAKPVPAS